MVVYLAMRIMDKADTGKGLDYVAVVTKFPQYKNDIDAILIAEGREELIIVS